MSVELHHRDWPAQPAYRHHTAERRYMPPLTLPVLGSLVRCAQELGVPDTATFFMSSDRIGFTWQSYDEPQADGR